MIPEQSSLNISKGSTLVINLRPRLASCVPTLQEAVVSVTHVGISAPDAEIHLLTYALTLLSIDIYHENTGLSERTCVVLEEDDVRLWDGSEQVV
jgi:hypothetical protein